MEFICLDIETTGLDLETAEIIEVAAVRFNRTEILGSYQTFVNYTKPIPEIVEHLTGINVEMTKDAPHLHEVKQAILDFCGDAPIVGHNINFDINFLRAKGVDLQNTLFDTLPLSHILVKDIASHSLEVLCRTFNKTYFPNHRAEDDCNANIELFWLFLNKIENLPVSTSYIWNQILIKSNNQWGEILLDLIPEGQESEIPKASFLSADITQQKLEPIEFSELNLNYQEAIKSHSNDTLFITTQTTFKKLDPNSYTPLPESNSEISLTKFQNYLQKDEITYEETILLLKIAKLLNEKSPVYREDLNLFGDDYHNLNYFTEDEYRVPTSQKPYLTNHFTFFKLLAENKLISFKNIYFEDIDYAEETFVRANEKQISLSKAEFGTQNLNLALAFRELQKVATRLKATDNAEFYEATLLTNLTFNTPEITEILETIQQNSANPELKANLTDLKVNFNKYLIWIRENNDGIATLSYVNKNIDLDFNLERIAQTGICQNFYTVKDQSQNQTVSLQVPNDFADPNDYAFNQVCADYLFEELKDLEGQALVICPAKVIINSLHKNLALKFNALGINLLTQDIGGSKGKILSNLENNEAPSILVCTQYFFLRNYPEMKSLQKVYITKFPMSLPNHIFYEFKKSTNPNSFSELLVPSTAQTIAQIINQAKSENPALDYFRLLDTRIFTKNWGVDISNHFPNNIVLSSCQ
jgi:DNA polymerase III epsilon subunit family exonuclease